MVIITINTAHSSNYELGQNCMVLKIMNNKFIEDFKRENVKYIAKVNGLNLKRLVDW